MTTHRNALPGPDDITRVELPNGIVVLVRENFQAQSVVIAGALDSGSLLDPPELEGLASFAASMLMRGTETRDFSTIHEMLEGSGASLSISAGKHTVGFSGKSLSEDLAMLLDLLADVLRFPAFPAEHVERLRGQIVTGIRVREQDTRFMAGRAFREMIYPGGHPYSRDTRGTLESVPRITRDHLVDFHRTALGPARMLLVVVGAVDAARAVRLVTDKLGDWSTPGQRELPALPELSPMEAVRLGVVDMPGKSQSDLMLGVAGPSRFVEDWHAAELANNILGVFGMYGRIGAVVREKQGMAYYSYSQIEGGLGPGAWRVMAGVNPANIDRTVEAIRDEIRRITNDLVSPEELADNKANFIGRLPLELERNEGVAGVILMMERYGLGLDYLRRYAELINAVTTEDVLAAAQRYLDPDIYALAVAGEQPVPVTAS